MPKPIDSQAEFKINIPLAERISVSKMTRGLRAVGLEGERLTKAELSKPGSGRTYTRGGVVHTASKPGEPPAPDTGELRRSVTSDVVVSFGEIAAEISIEKEYAAALELGTEKMEPRPTLSTIAGKYANRLIAAFGLGARG